MPRLSILNNVLEFLEDLACCELLFLVKNVGWEHLLLVVDASLDHLFNYETSFVSNVKDLAKLSMSKDSLYFVMLEETWFLLPASVESLESSSSTMTPMDHIFFYIQSS